MSNAEMQHAHVLPTHYKGILFRSRTEARWAFFLDHLSLRWFYEYEGYNIPVFDDDKLHGLLPVFGHDEPTGDSLWYLPDFWVPGIGYIEVKPPVTKAGDWPDHAVMTRAIGLQWVTGQECYVLCGPPGRIEPYEKSNPYEGFIAGDCSYYWCICPDCGAVGIQFDGRSARNSHKPYCRAQTGDKGYCYDHPLLLLAYDAVQGHRFV